MSCPKKCYCQYHNLDLWFIMFISFKCLLRFIQSVSGSAAVMRIGAATPCPACAALLWLGTIMLIPWWY